jgi:hypothetical protein
MRLTRLGAALALFLLVTTSGCCGWHRCCHRHPIRNAIHRRFGADCCESGCCCPSGCDGCGLGAPVPVPVAAGPIGPPPLAGPPLTPLSPPPMSPVPNGPGPTYLRLSPQ